jgi:hypothetical protein
VACSAARNSSDPVQDNRVLAEYQQQLRAKHLSAPLVGPPEPWRAMARPWSYVPVGGLQGVGFL